MNVKLLTEHHFEFLSLIGGCTGSSEYSLSKCHIVGNIMSQLIFKHVGYSLLVFCSDACKEHNSKFFFLPGRVAQSVTCLATDACLTADPGVLSSIPARSHTFVEIDHEIISTVILLLPLIYSRRIVVSYKRKYVHELLVNRLCKPAQEKVWIGELTVPQ